MIVVISSGAQVSRLQVILYMGYYVEGDHRYDKQKSGERKSCRPIKSINTMFKIGLFYQNHTPCFLGAVADCWIET